jgi:hypothetical protein
VFNHYHRVTNLLNAADQVDNQEPPASNQRYLDPSLSDTDISFSGSTAATATITPKSRRRKVAGTTETMNASSTQDLFDEKFTDEDKFGLKREMDPTLVHSPSEWSGKFSCYDRQTSCAYFLLFSLNRSVQPGFYDKAFPPPPHYSSKPVATPPNIQPSTLLGRLARASVSAARSSVVDSREAAESPFADIRATNSPPPLWKNTQASSSASPDHIPGARELNRQSGISDKQRNDKTEDLECEEGEVSSKMDEIVIEKSNVLMMYVSVDPKDAKFSLIVL